MVLEVGLDPPEDELVALGVAPAEIPIDDVAGEIVRGQSVRTGLDEREAAQPVERLADIGSAERRPQQGFGGDPGQGARLQRLPLLERRVPCRETVGPGSPPGRGVDRRRYCRAWTTWSASSDRPSGWP